MNNLRAHLMRNYPSNLYVHRRLGNPYYDVLRRSQFRFRSSPAASIAQNNEEENEERIQSLEADVERLTSDRDKLRVQVDSLKEKYQKMCQQEREMEEEANMSKNEIVQCKKQIEILTIRNERYQKKDNEMKATKNENKSLTIQLDGKIKELARMRQTLTKLTAHEEMVVKLSKEKKKLEEKMSSVDKKLKHMTTRVQNSSKLIDENENLNNSIESLKGRIKNKDEEIQKCNEEYQSIVGELAAHQFHNSKILKMAKRSDEAFKRKRTNKDREIFSEKLFRAENNQKQHMSEANVWGKCAKRMRNIVKRNSTENDEDISDESCSESSDDCSVNSGKSELSETSEKRMSMSNRDKLRKTPRLRKESTKEM
ncbi:Hypothetical predicted protein [Mytilus galloprovincialis]|uniref:Uncharacterized protein n=1 Tax=Mytilus galloprovincialis TaxID=29158 RepID=A0A8B6DRG0_MYTGA|nr:Hypothetical predicted protein [Mytilus galloprovincialis]